jgi:hypothetical protein
MHSGRTPVRIGFGYRRQVSGGLAALPALIVYVANSLKLEAKVGTFRMRNALAALRIRLLYQQSLTFSGDDIAIRSDATAQ